MVSGPSDPDLLEFCADSLLLDSEVEIDQKVLRKIRKAMALASHPGTGEAEAKRALR